MDDLVNKIHQQPWFEQNIGNIPVYYDLHAVPEAAAGLDCLSTPGSCERQPVNSGALLMVP